MKKLITFIVLFVCLIFISSISSFAEENEIIPFHPDPSLVTEWDVSEQGSDIEGVTFDTPILKVIIPEGVDDVSLYIEGLDSSTLDDSILWIYPTRNEPINMAISFYDSYISTIWLGGGQSVIPTMYINYLAIWDGNYEIEDIYLYSDVYINIADIETLIDVNIYLYSYNFEYELNHEYQSGYNDGYDDGYDDGCGEDEPFLTTNQIMKLMIALVIYIVALFVGMLIKSKLLLAMTGLLWLIPLVTIDNIIIRIFSIIMLIISLMILLKERDDYYD